MGMTPIYEALCAELATADSAGEAPAAATDTDPPATGADVADAEGEAVDAEPEAADDAAETTGWVAPGRVA